jgi:hypothetical protein
MRTAAELTGTVTTMGQAAGANFVDAWRRGSEIVLPAEGDCLVVGDLHGHAANLERAVAQADLDHHPKRHLVLQEVIHQLALGEDHSFELLEAAAALKIRYPDRVHVILGNHDLAEWQGREIFKGGLCLNLLFRSGIRNAYGDDATPTVHRAYQEFIATMPLAVRACGDLLIVHTTPERRYLEHVTAAHLQRDPTPDDWKPRGWVEQLVWGRDFAQATADAFASQMQAAVFIVGHTPCRRGYRVPNTRHVIIDSKDDYGVTVLLDLARRYTQAEVVAAIRPLVAGRAIGPEAEKGARRAS